MPRHELLDSLKRLGLNEYESKTYSALSRFGSATPAVLSKDAGIPRARIYDVLSSLEAKGFVVRRPSKPVEFKALRLETVYKNLALDKTERHHKDLQELKTIAFSLSSLLEGAKEERQGVAEDAVILTGRHTIYNRIAEETDNCRESVVICSDREGIKRKQGVLSAKNDKLARKGVKVHYKASPTGRYAVFDQKRVLLFLHPPLEDPRKERALFLESPFLAAHLHPLKKP
ncbi:MAG TPA: TrmB family transcriptional regulator [Candidatus Diapherotrites archaeon]|uniref:TrmB family transcriptional regulator n=1 Tax=Candidatus Iainarchaeum sp. TaxID=3101447 RepID=A0A7J4JGN8_9ARCH|nr:TrmB family transcriptional regulator [Candidatus Diapherotrites archaeon]HIH16858.1 TrmB family transcriptional regulator [Candidatus Diapherotrites archaeon]